MEKLRSLIAMLRQEPGILSDRITAEVLQVMIEQGTMMTLEMNNVIIACCAIWETETEELFELGTVWVHPDYRDHRLASLMFAECTARVKSMGAQAFLITKHPAVVHLAQKHGWHEATRENWSVIVPFEASCGVCASMSEAEKPTCPHRAVREDCQMFTIG
ncbi:MAG TPA: GNAT family N-acetyltransferase [Patescibacteria group bacterium]|nr:GNAT family N-acetyltransferase [Patescibacteria group bacterium]